SRASAAHSVMTGQCRQITAAFLCAAPLTNSSSGSVVRQRALATHALRASSAHHIEVFAVVTVAAPPCDRCVPQHPAAAAQRDSVEQKSRRTYVSGKWCGGTFSKMFADAISWLPQV